MLERSEKRHRNETEQSSAVQNGGNESCQQTITVRQNILNLANFIFKRTYEVLAHPAPEKLEVLININMQIANGLSGKAE